MERAEIKLEPALLAPRPVFLPRHNSARPSVSLQRLAQSTFIVMAPREPWKKRGIRKFPFLSPLDF
jgi:hypothetical protein